MEAKLAAVSGKSKLAEAIRYALSRWAGLTDATSTMGRIEIYNNVVERADQRLIASASNYLFRRLYEGGNDIGLSMPCLLKPWKMNDVDCKRGSPMSSTNIGLNRHPMSKIEYVCRGPRHHKWHKACQAAGQHRLEPSKLSTL